VAATAGAGGPVWDIRALRYPASARP
jgi:hypothetical protein